jgi:uncharacterized protein YecE (DUF72 family)
VRVGVAGWAIPRASAEAFPAEGSGLQRYASEFSAVEINSTFYRSHRASTYVRWRETTPPGFQFALKLPRAITHEARLVGVEALVIAFRKEAELLGDKLGPLLVQLPPSLIFSLAAHGDFFLALRRIWREPVVCEPRHGSWFDPEADALLRAHRVSRVAADPARHPGAGSPGGWRDFAYWRLHGSPRMYSSAYGPAALDALALTIERSQASQNWCIFDNTARGAATADALVLQARINDG